MVQLEHSSNSNSHQEDALTGYFLFSFVIFLTSVDKMFFYDPYRK